MRSYEKGGQLLLFPAAAERSERAGRRAPGTPSAPLGRNVRMASRMDVLARTSEREATTCRRAGDTTGERQARDQAADARRAAALLRAGREGVGRLLAS